MNSYRVLLVEDIEVFDRQLRDIFENVDRYPSAAALVASKGRGWKYAFVDFDLKGEETGLSVLNYLHRFSPETKIVIFTTLTENGRGLFAMAAWHWYKVWAVRDKDDFSDDVFLAIRDKDENPTVPRTKTLLDAQAWRIDTLFPIAQSVKLHSIWVEFGASTRGIEEAYPSLGNSVLIKFSRDIREAVEGIKTNCRTMLPKTAPPASRSPKKTQAANNLVTTQFIATHSIFFYAVELERVVRAMRPWERKPPAIVPTA
jgi:ActR/RegA family two-component response regulator